MLKIACVLGEETYFLTLFNQKCTKHCLYVYTLLIFFFPVKQSDNSVAADVKERADPLDHFSLLACICRLAKQAAMKAILYLWQQWNSANDTSKN